jgi:AcrR family transcriptional regulator
MMVKHWPENDPKAGLMARKRAQIVAAARQAFLDEGYAGSSVNRIADAAGVSIKTLYRHFESKDDLFSAVMQAACENPSDGAGRNNWEAQPPESGIALAGEEYLRHALSPDQIALSNGHSRLSAFPGGGLDRSAGGGRNRLQPIGR